jgi:hypothetical protein
MKDRTKKKRIARWQRHRRIMSWRCLDAHDRWGAWVRWSWLAGFYRVPKHAPDCRLAKVLGT